MGVSVPHVIDGFQVLYASDFNRLGYIKDGSFCSGMRRPLRRPSECISWHGWSTVPPICSPAHKRRTSLSGLVCFMFEKSIDWSVWIVTPSHAASPSGLCFVAAWKTKTRCFFFFFTIIMASFPQTRPPESIIFNMCYSWKEQRLLYCLRRTLAVSGTDWCSIYINRHLGSGGRISPMFYVMWNRRLFPSSVFQALAFFGDAVGKAIGWFKSSLRGNCSKQNIYSFISVLPDGKCEKLSYFGSYACQNCETK